MLWFTFRFFKPVWFILILGKSKESDPTDALVEPQYMYVLLSFKCCIILQFVSTEHKKWVIIFIFSVSVNCLIKALSQAPKSKLHCSTFNAKMNQTIGSLPVRKKKEKLLKLRCYPHNDIHVSITLWLLVIIETRMYTCMSLRGS